MAELADAVVSKAIVFGHESSSLSGVIKFGVVMESCSVRESCIYRYCERKDRSDHVDICSCKKCLVALKDVCPNSGDWYNINGDCMQLK